MDGRSKKKIVVIVSLVLLPFICLPLICTIHGFRVRSRVRAYHTSYMSVQRGMHESDVLSRMGKPKYVGYEGREVYWWDDEPLDPDQIGTIKKTLIYCVSTFFLPICFKFSIDTVGIVVGKHRYD